MLKDRLYINWSEWRDSNSRPSGPKPDALPDCATPRYTSFSLNLNNFKQFFHFFNKILSPTLRYKLLKTPEFNSRTYLAFFLLLIAFNL